jgi:PelA/Pel-15E family pectate lyase
MKLTHALCLGLTFGVLLPASPAIVGTNSPALPITAERIATLPTAKQAAWRIYLEKSDKQRRADQQFLLAELKKNGLKESFTPPHGGSESRSLLKHPATWYGQSEGRRIADIVVSFQTPAGGWSKNLDMTQSPRKPGEQFSGDNNSMHLGPADNDIPKDVHWSYVGTFDNDATIKQLRYLAKVISATGPAEAAPYRAAFLRGLDYIFAAQYPNGGWPQVWPLQGGYHDAITYNDEAMSNILELLQDVAVARDEFAFVPRETRTLATTRLQQGIQCILDTQIVVHGRRTVWCQQHDPLTLQPAPGRNYEMPSQCDSESAEVMMFLMKIPKPGAKTVAAVHAAAAWFERTGLHDVAFKAVGEEGRQLVPEPGGKRIWARYYEIGSDRPIFGDRDRTIHDTVIEISKERRNGYGWFNDTPTRALQVYATWKEAHPGTETPGS